MATNRTKADVGTAKTAASVKKAVPVKKAPAKKAAPVKKAVPVKKAPAKKAASAKSGPGANGVSTTAVKEDAGPSGAGKAGADQGGRRARSPFKAAFLKAQRALLEEERAIYVHQAESLRAEAESLVADFESGDVQFDEESGEGDTLSIERERDLVMAAQALEVLSEIDHALAKLDSGTYGICETSGLPIPEARLEAIPWARQRVEYKVGGLGRR